MQTCGESLLVSAADIWNSAKKNVKKRRKKEKGEEKSSFNSNKCTLHKKNSNYKLTATRGVGGGGGVTTLLYKHSVV